MFKYLISVAVLLVGGALTSPAAVAEGTSGRALGAVDTRNAPSGPRYTINYYSDYQSCVDGFTKNSPAADTAENVAIPCDSCFGRKALPYYTLQWWDTTLVRMCYSPPSDQSTCGDNCWVYNQTDQAIICATVGSFFLFG